KSRMILYHRVPFKQIQGAHYDFFQETTLLTLAEAAEIYHFALGSYKFDYNMFRRQEGTFYTTQALDLLETCVREYDVFEHLSDDSYQKEIDAILEYMIFTNEEKKKYMETLMYCIGFKSEAEVVNAVSSLCISQNLAQKLGLGEEDSEKLYYASLIHDIGMLSISRDIIDAARKLTDEEIALMRTHIEREEKILLNRMDPEVVKIATAHHERCDGSGYPKGLREEEMNTEQFILQVADVVTGLSCDRSYRKAFEKDQIIEILNDEMERNKLNKNITKVFIDSYDEIMAQAKDEAKKTLEMYNILGLKYEAVKAKLSGGQ
ncbi:MAG: HD domain-containing protein, partial [Lachnospiraceae bacterium]|nr:HD domain-containing protein [Lachnospiraceae bacterium]